MDWGETWNRGIDGVVPDEATHIGLVIFDNAERILGRIPKPPSDGVTMTFPRVPRSKGEMPSQTLQRVVREHVGFELRGCYPLEGLYQTQNSTTFYFVATPLQQPWKEADNGFIWVPATKMQFLLEKSHNPTSRHRDLKVLAEAQIVCPCPWRRFLLMVRELHLRGYERFRACPYNYPLAWRCPVVPKHWVQTRHGGVVASVAGQFPVLHSGNWTYTGASLQQPYEWEGAFFDTPAQLAQRFLIAFPELTGAGWGTDQAYVDWYAQLLRATAPFGLPYAFGEFEPERQELYVQFHTDLRAYPLPPPGDA